MVDSMHNPRTIIVIESVIGMAPDGSSLRRWTESDGRTFEEACRYDTTASGINFGAVYVKSIPTPN